MVAVALIAHPEALPVMVAAVPVARIAVELAMLVLCSTR
jgi:hypothetical protein